MKKIKYLCGLLIFVMFVPEVYAFSYDMDVTVDDTNVTEGSVKEILVSLKNVQGVNSGNGTCSLDIVLDNTITINGLVKALNNWNLDSSLGFVFNTSKSFVSGSNMILIPVEIHNSGNVKLANIKCSDGNTEERISDKIISFTIGKNDNDTNNLCEGNCGGVQIISSPNLSNIELTEGIIAFSKDITEYNVSITNFEQLDVYVELESSDSSYTIDKNNNDDGKSVVITVIAANGDTKTYTINVTEVDESVEEDNDNKKKHSYIPIFACIICLLVLINVFRIVKKLKK